MSLIFDSFRMSERFFFDVVLEFILEEKGFTYFFMPIFGVGISGGNAWINGESA